MNANPGSQTYSTQRYMFKYLKIVVAMLIATVGDKKTVSETPTKISPIKNTIEERTEIPEKCMTTASLSNLTPSRQPINTMVPNHSQIKNTLFSKMYF